MICLSIFVATGGLLVYAVWRFRARPGDAPGRIEQTYGNPKIELTLIGVVIPLLLIIAIPNLQALFTTSAPPDREAVLRVDVTGRHTNGPAG